MTLYFLAKALVRRFKVPLPQAGKRSTPLFTEPEIREIVETNILRKLAAAGVDVQTLQLVVDCFGNVQLGDYECEKNRRSRSPNVMRIAKSEQRTSKRVPESPTLRLFLPEGWEGGDV